LRAYDPRSTVRGVKKGLAALALGAVLLALAVGAPAAAPPRDHAAVALNVLPPGQSGSLQNPATSRDQLRLYDGLTPLFDAVKEADLRRFFKPAPLGLGGEKVVRREATGRQGLRILRDRFGVPHVYGRTRADVTFGAGWVTAQDRGLFMELLRGPGYIAALDVPGQNAFALATSARAFTPSPQARAFVQGQVALLQRSGPKARQLLADVRAYVSGINAYIRKSRSPTQPWTIADVIAVGSLLGANLGVGGGDETRRSMFLSALQQELGEGPGRAVWDDLRRVNDPETPVTASGRFPYGTPATGPEGSVVIDDGSFRAPEEASSAPPPVPRASNALLLGRTRSQTGRPLFVAGPQVGYFYPQILLELDLHGGGIDARGASFPGLSFYVLLGRAKDYAWSATSSNSDIVDHFVETLCGTDLSYRYQGTCRTMEPFEAGVLKGRPGEPDRTLRFHSTVHGPVIGYAKVKGTRVAISSRRATRGRELLSAIAFQDLNMNRVRSAQDFFRTMNQLEFTFNWFYADNRDIAMFSSGRLPQRSGRNGGLPTIGTGEYEWRGFEPLARHARVVNPPSGALLNWNNKPARDYGASDDNWAHGSVQRVDLLSLEIAKRRKHTLTSVVAAMNKAATQDLRAIRVLPVVAQVLQRSPAPSARAQRVLEVLLQWRERGASRLDRNLDGKIDDAGAAIMDIAWPHIADAVMSPVLGPLTSRLAALLARDDPPGASGSSYYDGWYGYVDKDLRTQLANAPVPVGTSTPSVEGRFSRTYCGGGDLIACSASLWAALEAASGELAGTQGPEPAAWRANAEAERIRFGTFFTGSMRWANRPTFQQVMTFRTHRPRPGR